MVIISQTFEHLYNPFLVIANIYNALRGRGYIFVSVLTLNIQHMIPVHFFHFTPVGLAVLFAQAGFEMLKWASSEILHTSDCSSSIINGLIFTNYSSWKTEA